jgi:hypothetical protein
MTIQLTHVMNTGDKRGAGDTYTPAGDPRNLKVTTMLSTGLVLPPLEVYL